MRAITITLGRIDKFLFVSITRAISPVFNKTIEPSGYTAIFLIKTLVIFGSKSVPAFPIIYSAASWGRFLFLYTLSAVRASYTSAIVMIRENFSIWYSFKPRGYPVPFHFSWCWHDSWGYTPAVQLLHDPVSLSRH